MKRSEAISQLEELLETIPVSDNGSYYEDAETILYFIEEILGMQPPYASAMRYKTGRSGVQYFSDDYEDGFQWEPENA